MNPNGRERSRTPLLPSHSPVTAIAYTNRLTLVTTIFALLLTLGLFPTAAVQAQNHPNGVDFLGPDGVTYPDFTHAGLPNGNIIPDVPVVVTISPGGNDKQNIENAIQQAHNMGGGAILLSNGVYNVSSQIDIPYSNIVLRGQSRTGTIVNLTGTSSSDRGLFHFRGTKGSNRRWLQQPVPRGAMEINLNGSSGFTPQVGEYMFLCLRGLPPEFENKFKPENYSGYYAEEFAFDMLKVVETDGDILKISTPIKEGFDPSIQDMFLEPMNVVRNCGVENLTIETPNKQLSNGVTFEGAAECWVKSVTINKVGRHPVYYSKVWGAKHILIEDCVFDDAWHKGGGAQGYGGFEWAYDCMMRNVVMKDLRHAPNVQGFASGNVFTNCDFYNSNAEMHTFFARHNLIENCRIFKGDHWHGPIWTTKYIDAIDHNHNPGAGRHVLFNNYMDGGTGGGGLRIGGLNYWDVYAYNFIDAKGTSKNGVLAFPIEIFDFCDEMAFVGNVVVNRKESGPMGTYNNPENGSYEHAAVVFQPGYKANWGQTGIGTETMPYAYQYAQHKQPDGPRPDSPPIMQGTYAVDGADIHFIHNQFFGNGPNRGFVGYNTPATDINNTFKEDIPAQLPQPEPFAVSLYEWQMQVKQDQIQQPGGVFPVELLSFDVQEVGGNAGLSWKTTSEVNSAHFVIERSTDFQAFELVDQVPAAGTSDEVRTYSFQDEWVQADVTYYYRLRMVDLDGAFEYSNTLSFRLGENKGAKIDVYPNPVQDAFTVDILPAPEQILGSLQLTVVDQLGRHLYRHSIEANTPDAQTISHRVQVGDWVPGIYYVTLSNPAKVLASKIIVVTE